MFEVFFDDFPGFKALILLMLRRTLIRSIRYAALLNGNGEL